ncbi:MAG TPA: hypothetical protein PLQ76_00445 [bacterium]|nr:hypothetical protein [bacterium]
MRTIIATLIALAVGFAVAWMPFGYFILAVFALLTALFAIRHLFDAKFRNSDGDGDQFVFFLVYWAVIGFYHIHPTGLDTMLAPMNIEKKSVGEVLRVWDDVLPNVKIECDPDVAKKKVSFHTIRPISVMEALRLIEKKAGADFTYEQNGRGCSMARGPKVSVAVFAGKPSPL